MQHCVKGFQIIIKGNIKVRQGIGFLKNTSDSVSYILEGISHTYAYN